MQLAQANWESHEGKCMQLNHYVELLYSSQRQLHGRPCSCRPWCRRRRRASLETVGTFQKNRCVWKTGDSYGPVPSFPSQSLDNWRKTSVKVTCIRIIGLYRRRLATTDMGRKLVRGCVPFLRGRAAGSQSNTMWPGPRPTSLPSDIVIHPTVWPQYTIVKDRQADRQDSGPIA